MTYDLALNGGDIVHLKDGQFLTESANVAIQSGKIAAIGSTPFDAKKVVQAKGLTLLPGLIDSQVHFREPGFPHKEDIETGSKAAALGGITSFFEMPNTVPATTSEALLKDKQQRAQGRSWVNYAFYIGANTENSRELAKLEALPGCPGVKVFVGSSTGSLLIENDEDLEQVLLNIRKPVIFHSEDEFRLRERKQMAMDSKDVSTHPVWRDVESAVSATRRLIALARKLNHPIHILHISTAEELELIRQNKDLVSAEVLPQHLSLFAPDCYQQFKSLAQQNPPIREERHMQALWKAVLDGTIDVMGSDHAPHTLEEKSKPYPQSPSGMPMVQTLLPLMLDHVNAGRLSLHRFVELMTEGPRRLFKIKNKGRLAVDYDADLTVVDLKAEQTIRNSWIASRCGWTLFDGKKVKGWPKLTIVGGQIVMQEDQLIGCPAGQAVEFEEVI